MEKLQKKRAYHPFFYVQNYLQKNCGKAIKNFPQSFFITGGLDRARTYDLVHVKHAL